MLWKNLCINGSLLELFDIIKKHHVIFISPDFQFEIEGKFDSSEFGELLGLKNYYYINVHRYKAYEYINTTFKQIMALEKKLSNETRYYIMVPGTVANALIFKLHNRLDNASLWNVGATINALLPYCPRSRTKVWLKQLNYINPEYMKQLGI